MARLATGASGVEVCRELSDAYDRLIEGLWEQALAAIPAARGAGLALVATGGWGRREVCPFSDIDFILVTPGAAADCSREVADRLLYPLWDAGVDVGHAVRSAAAAARLARDDLPSATALIDARHVVGDPATVADLDRATRRVIAPGGNPNEFIDKLADEKRQRHQRFGDSLYLLEPNLKQGIGALRDIATAIWAARARWQVSDLRSLVGMGHLSSRQVAVLGEALDFMLELRSLLQLTAGRRTDQLTFEIQETVAPRLYPNATLPAGDIRPAVAPAVEALMRRYYLHARGVARVGERLLEAATVPARRRPRIVRVDSGFLTFNGKLAANAPDIFRKRPAEALRYFCVALEHGFPLYGHTKELIEDFVTLYGGSLTSDLAAAAHFLSLLVDPRDSRQPALLEEMHQVGLLSALMPEFAPCTCRVQHDLYHVYTVDQHQLYAVAMLKRIARGELADDYPMATEALAAISEREPLYLATLLHDIGKPLGKGHSEKGARLVGTIARRLGLEPAAAAKAELLVREHLTMSHLSQRRDLSDIAEIERFADLVGDEETLAQLYLLTLCDTAMTSPGNLNAWKEQLLSESYSLARAYLRGERDREPTSPFDVVRAARRRVFEILTADGTDGDATSPAAVERLLERFDDRFFTALTPRQVARHVELAWARERSGTPVAYEVSHYPIKGHSELAIVTDDVHGLLAAIAGVLAANRMNVLAAMVGCRNPELDANGGEAGAPARTESSLALDLFCVRDLRGRAIPADDPRWTQFHADLTALLAAGAVDGVAVRELMSRRRPRSVLETRVTPEVPTAVSISNDVSHQYTVVEVATRDRVGVLHAITQVFADMGLDIHLAKVDTEGEKVADAFYVTAGDGGGKLSDPALLQELEERLRAELGSVEGA